jgi:hypothetical protein
MRINGEWLTCDDGIVRPVLIAEVQASDGTWVAAPMLIDSGADCTALSSKILALLNIAPTQAPSHLGGIGGAAESVVIETQQLLYDDGRAGFFRGQFAAFTSPEAADMSILGRDILGLFAVIIDQPGDVVCLIGQRHRYVVESN